MTDPWSKAIDAMASYLDAEPSPRVWVEIEPRELDALEVDGVINLHGLLRAALTRLEADGWVLVPMQPTQDMAVSGLYAADRDQHHPAAMSDRYHAMIAARPPFPEIK